MKRTLFASLLLAVLWLPTLQAEPKSHKVRAPEAPVTSDKPEPVIDFGGEDIKTVLGSLARLAKMNLVIGDKVQGTISLRFENKTAREVIQAIVEQKDLTLENKNGIYFVDAKHPVASEPPKLEKSFEEAITEHLSPAITKLYDAVLDYYTRPEVAQKLAKSKKLLYDALIAEGFTKEEAFRLILADRDIQTPDLTK